MSSILFSQSGKLRQGDAVPPSQSVTATVFHAVTQQWGSSAKFYQHTFSIHGLFFGLHWTSGHSLLHAPMQRMLRQKQTALL